jgi:hypothetical protein
MSVPCYDGTEDEDEAGEAPEPGRLAPAEPGQGACRRPAGHKARPEGIEARQGDHPPSRAGSALAAVGKGQVARRGDCMTHPRRAPYRIRRRLSSLCPPHLPGGSHAILERRPGRRAGCRAGGAGVGEGGAAGRPGGGGAAAVTAWAGWPCLTPSSGRPKSWGRRSRAQPRSKPHTITIAQRASPSSRLRPRPGAAPS